VVVVTHVSYPRPADADRRWGVRFKEMCMSKVARVVSVVSIMLRTDARVQDVWCSHGGDLARTCPVRRPYEVAACHRFSNPCSPTMRPLFALGGSNRYAASVVPVEGGVAGWGLPLRVAWSVSRITPVGCSSTG
jgi:hypothetical protein